MSLLHDLSFMAHFAQCKVSAKQQVNSMIDAIYAKMLLDLELWLNKHQSNDSVHRLELNHNEPTGEQMQLLTNTQQIHENVNCPPSLPPSNFGPLSNYSIKSEIDSDCEENVTDHNNLPSESQFDQSTEASNDHLQNEVSLSNPINIESMIKQEFDDEEEDGEVIDDDNVRKCKNCENGICISRDDAEKGENGNESSDKTQLNVHAASKNNQTNQCFQSSSITSIPLHFANNSALNDLSAYVQIEGQNTQIQADEFDDNDDDDYDEDGEEEYLNKPNCEDCANGDCDLDHENNNNPSDNEVAETDIETNLDEAQLQIDISVTNNTQMNNQNDNHEKCVFERNMEQSTPSTSGVPSSTRKRIQTKVFGDLVQSNGNTHNSAKRKSDQANKSEGKVKRRQVLDDDEDTDSDDQVDHGHSTSAVGEEIAVECTTNPIQPNLAQSNRHLQCSHCHKSFDRTCNLQAHLRVHTGERPFQCDLCDKRFKERSKLTRHQLIHQNIKRFQCGQCNKQFAQKVTLESHQRTHSGERLIQCNFCEKSFTELGHRKRHEQAIHLHVKPYRCKQCALTATQKSVIITHIRIVHFGLPKSIKQQRALNIIDHRDPKQWVEKV